MPNPPLKEASDAPADISRQYKRLSRSLQAHHGRWAFYVLRFDHGQLRAEITARLQQEFGAAFSLFVQAEQFPTVLDLEHFLRDNCQAASRIELSGLDLWLTPERVQQWNFRRNAFTQALHCPLLLWLTPGNLSLLATEAPDLWNWRTAIFDFCHGIAHFAPEQLIASTPPIPLRAMHHLSFAQRATRIDELNHYLRQPNVRARLDDPVLVDLQLELAELLMLSSRLDEAAQVMRAIPSTVNCGRKYYQQAEIADRLGKPDTARALYQQAQAQYATEQNGLGLANTLRSLGELEYRLGNLDLQYVQHVRQAIQQNPQQNSQQNSQAD